LIDALGRLQGSASKEFVLLVVGPAGSWNKSAGYIASLRRRIRELGMEGQVRFTGAMPHDRLRLLMANCDALVLPSRLEGRPNVILEAMASGIACVASRVGGCEEAIGHEGSGLTFEDENKEELGRILSRLINNPEEARRMGRIGRETAMQKYNWKKISLRLAALYEEVLGMAVPAQSA